MKNTKKLKVDTILHTLVYENVEINSELGLKGYQLYIYFLSCKRWHTRICLLLVYPGMMSPYGSVIITFSCSSLLLSTCAPKGRITPGSMMFAQSIVKRLKVIYLVDLVRRWKIDSVINSRVCFQNQRKQAFLTIFTYFSLQLYWRIYPTFFFPHFDSIVLSAASRLALLFWCAAL